jgi:hypothetical protein
MATIGLRLVRFAPSAIDRQLRYFVCSLLAILVAFVFLFPLYWAKVVIVACMPTLRPLGTKDLHQPWSKWTISR